jgi:hypothetical protein
MDRAASPARALSLPWAGRDGSAPLPPATEPRGLVACALWLHVGYVGAALSMTGVVQLATQPLHPVAALALMLCGCLLAVASVTRARVVLDRIDRARRLAPFRAR